MILVVIVVVFGSFRGPFLSILTFVFLLSLPLMPHNLHYHRSSMQPLFMLINQGAPKVFVFSLEIITDHKVFGNMNVIVFGNKTFVQMLGVIIGGT